MINLKVDYSSPRVSPSRMFSPVYMICSNRAFGISGFSGISVFACSLYCVESVECSGKVDKVTYSVCQAR